MDGGDDRKEEKKPEIESSLSVAQSSLQYDCIAELDYGLLQDYY